VKILVVAFTIKKRVYTKLFIDKTAALYMEETQIRVGITEGDQQVSTSKLIEGVSIPCAE